MIAYQDDLNAALAEMDANQIVRRIWDHDSTIWKPAPTGITNRLGWLHLPETMRPHVPTIRAFADSTLAEGYTHALLLGMGGSSLAPEVFSRTFDPAGNGRLALTILDSTDPGTVLAQAARHAQAKTLFIVSTKAGGTVETLSFFKFFYNRLAEAVGPGEAGRHFVAITDADTELHELAQVYRFREVFLNDPTVGGRFAALSLVGLVPAALVGVDLDRLLDRGAAMAEACREPEAARNPGARLGAIMGVLARAGRDKLTIVASPAVEGLVDWVEQLVAESTGKEGVGILPVVREPLGPPEVYGPDRLFVAIQLGEDTPHETALAALEAAGNPVVRLQMVDRYDLGRQYILWEFATAVAGHILGINPFDQPDVEAAKIAAREAVAAYTETGRLPQVEAVPPTVGALRSFLAAARPGDYVALQAFVQPTAETTAALQALRRRIRDTYRLATTVGFGPRFLHSTGQLHKGDGGNGLFIQFVADDAQDVPIPDEAGRADSAITFGVLKAAQAAGDRQALLNKGRRFLRFHLGQEIVGGLEKLGQL